MIQKKFSVILVFQYLIFKDFLKIDNRAHNVYWDALFTESAEGKNCVPLTTSSEKNGSSSSQAFF